MYKITTSINIHILPYMEEDENIIDVQCFETLPEFKQYMLSQLTRIQERVEKLTMKRIKEGITL